VGRQMSSFKYIVSLNWQGRI